MASLKLVVALLLAVFGLAFTQGPIATTNYGKIQGVAISDKVNAYFGIPFAAPPVGNKRFAAPSYPASWAPAIRDATQVKPACMQPTSGLTQSEDCLYLNVYVPKNAVPWQSNLPVLVYIHGGRYWTGKSWENQGEHLAAEGNAIVVTIAYRLGAFGFSAVESLRNSGSSNVGLKDQQYALQWVNNNIGQFGGALSKITILGESAGGSSVLHHLLMSSSIGLYKNAIIMSSWMFKLPTFAQGQDATRNLAVANGCPINTDSAMLSCLRALPAQNLVVPTSGSDYFQPMVDYINIVDQPLNRIQSGNFNKNARIMIGNVAEEGNFMALSRGGWNPPSVGMTNEKYVSSITAAIENFFTSAQISDIFDWYAPSRAALGNWYGAAKFFGEFYLYCGAYEAAQYFHQYSNFPVYTFIFDHLSTNDPEPFLGATHGNELDFLFNATVYAPAYDFTADDLVVSKKIMDSFSAFADSGSPANAASTSNWAAYNPANPKAYVLQYATGTTTDYGMTDICENWSTLFHQ